ncbi:hypothetical protein M427DRAFT_61932 [Gonapodya prolifera JEL478]|uniref:Uncharacterized protein n=1 Tax=Gonapodya prolifera (strain JEL478) TaxID=1344416 RepID=A0A139A1F9_GONPJ|nr:hypothetical protein M427DRAFT_61932 [Gonapodya prolifera JEL478]|eukprot:KXS10569.1 hypothetical protein M427DRAFT_61932 [Gonapodya prolifera JEL478]
MASTILQSEEEEQRLRAYYVWKQTKGREGDSLYHWFTTDKDAFGNYEYHTDFLKDDNTREQIEKRLADTFADLDFVPLPAKLYRVDDGTGPDNKTPTIRFTTHYPKGTSSVKEITFNPEDQVVDLTSILTQRILSEGAGFDSNIIPHHNLDDTMKDIYQLYKKPLMTLGILGFGKRIEPSHPVPGDDGELNTFDIIQEFVFVNPDYQAAKSA